MALFQSKETKSNRPPDEAGTVTSGGIGIAIWRNPSGVHDLRVGPAFSRKGDATVSVKTTFPLNLIDETVETIALAALSYSNDSSVPTELRSMLGRLGRSIEAMLEAFRDGLEPNESETAGFFDSVTGKSRDSNGIAQ